jgi:microcystin degradation protein MlrC
MRVFAATLMTETNTFSPFLTGMQNFEESHLVRGGLVDDDPASDALPQLRWKAMSQERGWEFVESLCGFAQPAGYTLRWVYEQLRDEILADLVAAMPVDMVLLNQHGAMVAQGYDDCEGDLTARVREIVGPHVPVGVELDLHCHITDLLVKSADAVITYKEYPHIDMVERGEELFTIIADAAQGKVKPVNALADCGMIGVFHTSHPPVRAIVNRMAALEGKDGVLSVSLGHGFPWGDVADLGTRVVVVTDNRGEHGQRLAEQLAAEVFAQRDTLQPTYLSIDEALDIAVAEPHGPVVLADVSDNAGGGAPNDSTFVLHRILERGISNVAIGCIWDPIAVAVAVENGEEEESDLRIGGKMGPMSGDPVDLHVHIGKIVHHATQRFGGGSSQLGTSVALHAANDVDIVLISQRTQTFSPHVFTNVGIDPLKKQILVVKSMQHFYAGFKPIAAKILYVAAPGSLVPNFKLLPYRKARRDIWPLNEGV